MGELYNLDKYITYFRMLEINFGLKAKNGYYTNQQPGQNTKEKAAQGGLPKCSELSQRY